MLRSIKDALIGVVSAIAGALLTVMGMKRALKPAPSGTKNREAATSTGVAERDDDTTEHGGTEGVAPQSLHDRAPSQTPRIPPGWTAPQPAHLSEPTYWPVVMALGITLLLWGIVTSFLISLVGLALFGLSLAGWIGDILHENKGH